jgi:hypothetical protein
MLLILTTTTTTTTTGTNVLLGYTTLYYSTGTIYDAVRESQIKKVIQQYNPPRQEPSPPDLLSGHFPNVDISVGGGVIASSAGVGANRTTATTTNNNNQDHNGGSGDEEEEEEDSKPPAVGTPARTSTNNNHNGGSGDDDDEEEEEEDSKPRSVGTHFTRAKARRRARPEVQRQASSPVARRRGAKKARRDALKLSAIINVVAERDARGEHVPRAMRKQVNEAATAARGVAAAGGGGATRNAAAAAAGGGGGAGGVLAPLSREISRGFWCVKPTQDKKTGETIPWLDKITGKPKPCGKGQQHKKYCYLHGDQIDNRHFDFES